MFQIDLEVRDYECDMQGIVNNAVYQHYFEHARHKFLNIYGIDFVEITKNGFLAVIYRAEIDYIQPLSSNMLFKVTVDFTRLSRLKGLFTQQIILNNEIYTQGKFYITALNSKKKPVNLDEINLNLCVN